MAELTLLLIRLGLSSTHANGFDIGTSYFQGRVKRFGALFRSYHTYRNSFLLKPGEYGLEDSTAVVLTDVLQVSLKRFGVGPARTQRLNVIVSVLRLKLKKKEGEERERTTWFVLAAHVCYLPESKTPSDDDEELDRDLESNEKHPCCAGGRRCRRI